MAALARATMERTSAPLDGLHPEALLAATKTALAAGLVDDLDWLAPAAAGAALYELASALPPSPEQRDLGRRVMARLLEGTAEVFVSIATRMAYGSTKGLASAAIRARVALVTELPIGAGVADGRLALALTSRRELSREWIVVPSTGSLPARRLAARLLERAAREASKQASLGDVHAVRAFKSEAILQAFRTLLDDRESLVWRHVAVARGLLSPFDDSFGAELKDAFRGPKAATQGRRAAVSLAALAALEPSRALKEIRQALASPGIGGDPGIYAAFAWGIVPAADAEPEAAAELIGLVLSKAPKDVAAAVVELRRELGGGLFVEEISDKVLHALGTAAKSQSADDGEVALVRELTRDLESTPRDELPVRVQLAAALQTYATAGAREAYSQGRAVLDALRGAVQALDAVSREDEEDLGRGGSLARRTAFAVLRDVDESFLERSVLSDLLRLGTVDQARGNDEILENVRQRLAEWLLGREAQPLLTLPGVPRATGAPGAPPPPAHPTLRMHRLRALLHLVDSEVGEGNADDGAHAARTRKRTLSIVRPLVGRFEKDPPSGLRRALVACLARGIDGLVRVGAWDVTDVALVLARSIAAPEDFDTLAEAVMHPDVVHTLERYALFLRACASDPKLDARLQALEALSKDFLPDGSARAEALRTTLVRLCSALQAIHGARSLRALATGDTSTSDALSTVESSLAQLAQLAAGARSRLEAHSVMSSGSISGAMATQTLSIAFGRVMSGAMPTLSGDVVAACVQELTEGLPRAIAIVVSQVLKSLATLPLERPSDPTDGAAFLITEQLPSWLPARRTLGGFYVVRGLGEGGVSSVFIATRVEDKTEPDAERFALKVPEYSATAARSVSESEFLTMFRAEAAALMALPPHKHIARFVTFDVGAKPKPILVMELVEGVSLQQVIETRALDIQKALRALDEVLDGLMAMHAVDIGHLDVKPSNVVLRAGSEAVLVDFGLSGRHIRPGCATGPYGAPEVWGVVPPGVKATPMAADVYAFGCLAFEALTGRTLFDADSEMVQVAMHVGHDGQPPAIQALSQQKGLKELGEFLRVCLRRNPKERPSAAHVRSLLPSLAKSLEGRPWPLSP